MILNSQHSSSRALAIFLLSKKKLLDCTELFELLFVSNRLHRTSFELNFSFIFATITLLLADMMDDFRENQAISHKRERRQKYRWSLKRSLLNTLRKILSIMQQRNSKLTEKESAGGSKRKRK